MNTANHAYLTDSAPSYTPYTSGPWRVGDAGKTVFGPPNGQPAPEVIANVRKAANSRLIALAPDLASALRELDHAALEMAQYFNLLEDNHDEGVSVMGINKMRQRVHNARIIARKLLARVQA